MGALHPINPAFPAAQNVLNQAQNAANQANINAANVAGNQQPNPNQPPAANDIANLLANLPGPAQADQQAANQHPAGNLNLLA
jgi:hypothetical protein